MTCSRLPTTTASECSMHFFPGLWFLSIGIRTAPRMYCCFMESWSRSFTRKSDLEMALNRSRIWQLGVASMKRHALSWTRPPAVSAASSPPASGTRSKSWSRPSSMKPRTGSTAKTGARLCEFGRGRDVPVVPLTCSRMRLLSLYGKSGMSGQEGFHIFKKS